MGASYYVAHSEKENQIVVLDKDKIVEVGIRAELIKQKGNYYYLLKNQLELGG